MADYSNGNKHASLFRGICMVALYGVILLAIIIIGRQWDRQEPQKQVYGSLEGRFTSDISLDYQGEKVYYRQNEITNYLLIGVDRDKLVVTDHQSGGQADFLLLLSVDRRNRTITPVMIDRDTMAQVPTYGVFGNAAGTRNMQICLAQAFSGSGVSNSRNTAKAVSSLLGGIRIDHYVLLDLKGIALLNDAVGGVTVTLEDDLTALDPVLRKGATVCLRGEMAEHFVRGRMTVADGTNLSRMSRQRTYIEALLDTVLRQMERDGTFASKLFDSLSGHMETDTDKGVLLSHVNAYYRYEWQDMQMLPGIHRLGEDGFAEFWPDEQACADLIVDIWFN